jgi:hypothetical protein
MARHVRLQPAGAGQLSYDVTSEVAMTGENLALLNQGTFCITLDTSAVYEAYPTGTTPPAGAITIAATNGVWVLASSTGGAPGTPAYNPTWYAAANLYLDPANSTGLASDSNNGTSAITPLLTFGKVIQKYGSTTPLLTNTQTLHLMSSQGAGDPVVFSPILTGGINFVLLGTPVAVGAPFSPVSVTAKNRATGTLLTLNTGGAATPGTLLFNVTKGSYAFVDSNGGGSGPLVMTQPFASAGLTTVTTGQETFPIEDDTWASTDSYQRYSLPQCNLKVIAPSGGDTSSTGLSNPVFWIQQVHVTDVSGSVGYSTYDALAQTGASVVHSMCWFDPVFVGRGAPDELNSANLCCWHNGSAAFQSWWAIGGASNTTGAYFLNATYLSNLAAVDGDIIIHSGAGGGGTGLIVKGGYSICGWCYLGTGASSTIAGSQLRIEPFFFASAQLYGPGGLGVNGGGAIINESGTTWAACFTLAGGITLDSATTGSAYALGTFVDGITLTAANFDTYVGLQNPRTGSRFSLFSGGSSAATAGGLILSGFTTSAMTGPAGQSAYASANSTATPTDNLVLAKSRFIGVSTGIAGQLQTGGVVAAVPMTTAGGSPAAGAPLWLAASTDEAAAVGKWTATAPTVAGTVVAEVGICLDNTNYAGAKTVKALIQVKPPVQL